MQASDTKSTAKGYVANYLIGTSALMLHSVLVMYSGMLSYVHEARYDCLWIEKDMESEEKYGIPKFEAISQTKNKTLQRSEINGKSK